jgi:hypothetical protein
MGWRIRMSFFYGFSDEIVKLADKIPGGVAEGMPDKVFNKTQLRIGTRVEKEHTPKASAAREIAKDHLSEQIEKGEKQDYYTKLVKMEGGHSKKANGDEEPSVKVPKNVKDILTAFFKAHPKPTDDQVHELAETHNLSPHTLEKQIYAMLGQRMSKTANGDMLQYFHDHPDKLREKLERDKAKLKRTEKRKSVKVANEDMIQYYKDNPKKLHEKLEREKKKREQKDKGRSFIRKAGPGLGALAGAGLALATNRPLLTGIGTGATIGWLPDIGISLSEAIKERKE